MKKCLTMWKMALSILVVCLSLTSVSALANGDKGFIMREVVAGIMTKAQGKIGNDEYFNGKGGATYDDFKIMIAGANNEFVYCIEPGVVSIDNSQYQGSNVPLLFVKAYNSKTTPDSKYLNVSKLLQLVQTQYRYDDGTNETRLHYLVIQTLIWEVMCEERNENFNYIGSKKGTTAITYLLQGTNQQNLNRFNELYDVYEKKMFQHSLVPSFTSNQAGKAPTVYLNQYDEITKEYYTILEDTHHVVEGFKFHTDDKVQFTINDNKMKITCKIPDYDGQINGYNSMVQGDPLNPKSQVIGHSQGNNQALVSLSSIGQQKDSAFLKVRSDNYTGTLSIDPNGGIYNGKKEVTVVKKMAGEITAIEQVSRSGYSFDRWQLLGVGRLENNQYTHSKGQATLTAQWTNHSPVITSPIVNGGDTYIEGENLIIQLGDKFVALDYATAYDQEDGDITDQLIVTDNGVLLDEQLNTIKSGQYKVTYQITDLAGAMVQKTITVIVNDPPVIKATDRYFFVDDEVTDSLLVQGVQATDHEDGNITNKVVISSKSINEHQEGVGEVTFSVTDRYRKTVYKKVLIHFLQPKERETEKVIRYIGDDYLGTLYAQSKWRINGSIHQLLKDSLDKEAADENSLYIFEWSREENNGLKQQLLSDGQILDLSFFNAYRQR